MAPEVGLDGFAGCREAGAGVEIATVGEAVATAVATDTGAGPAASGMRAELAAAEATARAAGVGAGGAGGAAGSVTGTGKVTASLEGAADCDIALAGAGGLPALAWAGGLPAREAVGEPDSGMAATTVGDGWFAGASRSWSGGAASAGGRSSTTLTRFTSAGAGGPSICEISEVAFRKPGSHRTPHAANAATPTTKPNRVTIDHRFCSPRRGRNDGSGIRLGASASWRCSSSIARSPIKAWPAMSSRFWVSVTNRWSEDRAGGKRSGGSSSSRWRIGELISVKLRRVQCSYCSTCTYLARRSIHRS